MQRAPRPGDYLGRRYRLDAEIGRGGHGVVFRAFDVQAGAPVAVKVLRQNIADDPQYAVRLWREAQSLAALFGSSVVRVHGFDHDESGAVYMVMELLEGETLDEHLAELESFGDRMSAYAMLVTLDPIARALHAAHEQGLVHRDVKPANIFLLLPEMGGGVRLMDFGLVKVLGADSFTATGLVAGSPSYIAPEVWRSEAIDHRIDVYSLGAVVFRALTGRPPFTAPSPLELYRKATTEPRPKLSPLRPELPREIDDWVERALALRRDDRYPWVPTMWNDLVALVMRASSPSADKARATFRLPG